MNSSSNALTRVTGIALVVLPLIAVALKFFSFGWMIVLLMMGPILFLLAGYALQIVIAAQGFLSKRALFATRGLGLRATIAAWVTSVAFVIVGVFMPDGGDSGYGSTLQVWLGAYGPNAAEVHASTDVLTEAVAYAAAAAWLLGFAWLVVEWVIALVGRHRANKLTAAAPAPQAP